MFSWLTVAAFLIATAGPAHALSAGAFVTGQGSFDVRAARESGYSGVLDVAGLSVRLDPHTGPEIRPRSASTPAATSTDDANWSSAFGRSGTDCCVSALALYNGQLILAGSFHYAGVVAASYVASWDGTAFHALGTGLSGGSLSPGVHSLSLYNGRLLAGGDFDNAGGLATYNIASWDGTTWSAVGGGTDGDVRALTVYNGSLVAGGIFSSAGGVPTTPVASWNGTTWSALATGISGGALGPQVYSLAVYNNGLYAGGTFTTAGGRAANRIARWNGTAWAGVGGGLSGGGFYGAYCFALSAYNNSLIAGGDFTTAGGVACSRIARWDGTSWSALGSGMDNVVLALAAAGTRLVAGGSFGSAGGVAASRVASWDGSTWNPLSSGIGGDVWALLAGTRGVTVGGAFSTAGGLQAQSIARWSGTAWSAFGASGGGLDGTAYSLGSYANDLVAGGFFGLAGDTPVNNIARWSNGLWSPVGPTTAGNGYVMALLEDSDLYIAETSDLIYSDKSQPAKVFRYDGVNLSQVGSNFTNTDINNQWSAKMYCLVNYRDTLIAGGGFTSENGQPISMLAKWTGTDWAELGGGVHYGDGHNQTCVRAAAVYNGSLIIGGDFTVVGSLNANYIAQWDGTTWSTLGSGVNDYDYLGPKGVYALQAFGGNLYAGGDFLKIGDVPATYVAAWNGASWSAVGSGFDRVVTAFGVYNGRLIAVGDFTHAGTTVVNHIAQLDSVGNWQPMGSGLNNVGWSVAEVQGHLYVGGDFTVAGASVSYHVAQWDSQTASFRPVVTSIAPGVAAAGIHMVPNPLSQAATLSYTLSAPAEVSVEVLDVRGAIVATPVRGFQSAGIHSLRWDGHGTEGSRLAPGVYLARVVSAGHVRSTTKIIVAR